MRIIKVGHSEIHPRQNLLTLEIAKDIQNIEIMSFAPKRWGDEFCPKHVVGLDPIFPEGQQPSFANMILKGLELSAGMNPDIVWCMQEPYTFLAMQCRNIAKQSGAKLVVFTWENKPELRFPGVFNDIEKQVLSDSDLVICGNSGAVERVHSIEPKANTVILPQTGVNVDLFKPIPEVKKQYDIGTFCRFVPEKLDMWNKLLEMRPDLKSLTVGGKGSVRPVSGTVIEWQKFENLPRLYNSLKCFVTIPYNHCGYNEQFNFTIGEAIACGIPTIISNNGSIPEVYGSVPNLFYTPQGKTGTSSVNLYVDRVLREMYDMNDEGRQWVIDNLSLQVIAKKYKDVFVELLK